jgi:hypothetical protein
MIAEALLLFGKQVRKGQGWQPELPASMATYVMVGCVLAFKKCVKEMAGEVGDQEVPVSELPPGADVATWEDPEDLSSVRDLIRQLGITDEQAKIAILTGYGFTQPEIAALLDTTDRGVEGVLRRLRNKFGGKGNS